MWVKLDLALVMASGEVAINVLIAKIKKDVGTYGQLLGRAWFSRRPYGDQISKIFCSIYGRLMQVR